MFGEDALNVFPLEPLDAHGLVGYACHRACGALIERGASVIGVKAHLLAGLVAIELLARGNRPPVARIAEVAPLEPWNLVDLDGVFVLTLMTPMVPEVAREIERLRIEAGFSVEEMLQELREQRAKYNTENYDDSGPSTENLP